MIHHTHRLGSVLADAGLQQGIKIMVHQFPGKGIFQYLVGEQHSACVLIRHVDGAAHIVQYLFQCRIRTCQGIFLDPPGQNTLQNLHCICRELDLRHAPHMPLLPVIQRQHYITALLLQDGEDHHSLHADLFDLL